jgi:hypothetical protein
VQASRSFHFGTMSANTAWQGQAPGSQHPQPFGNMDAINEQDFGLLDFEGFDFLQFDGEGKNQNGVDLHMLANAAAGQQPQAHEGQAQQQQRGEDNGQGQQMPQQMFEAMQLGMSFGQPPTSHGGSFSMPPAQHILQTHQIVPPTPNSVEMHGDMGKYLQQLDATTKAIIEHEYRMRQQDAVSYAVHFFSISITSSSLGGVRTELPVVSA